MSLKSIPQLSDHCYLDSERSFEGLSWVLGFAREDQIVHYMT